MPEEPSQQPSPNTLVTAVAFEGGIAVLAVAAGWMVGQHPLDAMHYARGDLLVGFAAGLVPMLVLMPCIWIPIGPFRRMLRVVDDLLVPLFRGCNLLDFAIIAVLAGLGEEMFFRTIVQEGLASQFPAPDGVWMGLAFSALLFGMAHWITPAYGIIAGAIGAYLGAIWLWSGNLLVPVTAHAVYDFLALVYLVKIRRPGPKVEVKQDEPQGQEGPRSDEEHEEKKG